MKEILKKISENRIAMFKFRVINGKYVNISFFPDYLDNPRIDLKKYKQTFLKKLDNLEKVFLELKNKDSSKNKVLLEEIQGSLDRIKFCKEVYDVEANKIDNNYKIEKMLDYDFYSYNFYGVKKQDIEKIDYLPSTKKYNIFLKKVDLEKLIKKALSFFPELKIVFSNVPNFVYISGSIFLPDKDYYSINEVIVLFFHEFTHYIRSLNTKQNLGFAYSFFEAYKLEEGLALYNEYFYGNQIIDYGSYYPYYHKVYNILMQDISKEDKLGQMHEILKYKGFSKEKTYNYFLRFYRFAPTGGNDFLLKETVYYNSYQNVLKLLENGASLDYLMSMKGGIETIDYFLNGRKLKNVNYKKYFETMVKDIKSLIP